MKLINGLLDKQLLDEHREPIGRVDGIVLVLRKGKAPRVAAMESGAATIVHRLHLPLARLLEWLERSLGVRGEGKPLRIPMEKLRRHASTVVVAIDAERANASPWEDWLREHVLRHIPGSGL